MDDSGLSDVSPEDMARAAALAAAMANESQYDKLDAMLAERAKTGTADEATEAVNETKQSDSSEGYKPTETPRRPHESTRAADKAQELIIPAQSAQSTNDTTHKLPLLMTLLATLHHSPAVHCYLLFVTVCRVWLIHSWATQYSGRSVERSLTSTHSC